MANNNKHTRLAALVAAVQPGLSLDTPAGRYKIVAALKPYAPWHAALEPGRDLRQSLASTVTAVRQYLKAVPDGGSLRPQGVHALSLPDTVLLRLAADLESGARQRLRRCKGCQEVFYARRNNMIYCSRKCASLEALTRYAARKKKVRRTKNGREK